MSTPRAATLAAACTAFVAVPLLGETLGEGEQTDRYDTDITPPGYAFAIWGAIFAACVVDAGARLRGTERDGDRATTAPLAAAYVANTAWSLAAQRDRFELTPGLLPLATAAVGLAHRRLQPLERPRATTVAATGLLLGWTTLASAVNVTADLQRRGLSTGRRAGTVSRIVAGAVLTTTVATSTHGRWPVAGAAAWGLLTSALDRRRPPATRAGSAALAAAVVSVGLGVGPRDHLRVRPGLRRDRTPM